jgi:rRNA-processing protein FCF1
VQENFLKDADIVIPEIVIQEIKRQKKEKLVNNKHQFFFNPLHKILDVNEATTKGFNVENYIQKLLEEEAIPFEVIDLKNNDVLPQIKNLALNNEPPFEENTDKGFKDTLIYFSVLEYLQEIPNKKVFVCTNDIRLKKALNNHNNIIVVENHEAFKQQIVSQFFDDYFIEKVNTELGVTITKENIIKYWHNIEDNQNVLIKVEDEEYIVELDADDIVSTSKSNLYNPNIEQLVFSSNFGTTHNTIEQLTPYINYFSDEEILKILDASFSNEQIKWIIEDEDVKEFIGTLYKAKSRLVENDIAEFLKGIFE